MLGSDIRQRMMVEVARGTPPSNSIFWPMSRELAEAWDSTVLEIAAMRERGEMLYIPNELPDLTTYERGTAPGVANIP